MNSINPNPTLSKRTLAREYAFKFLYKHFLPEFNDLRNEIAQSSYKLENALQLFDQSFSEFDEEHPHNALDIHTKKFSKELIVGALEFEGESLEKIAPHLAQKNMDRVDRMNLALLVLGVYELNHSHEKAPGIFINEYVNIAKKYCPNESAGFINSIMDKIAKENA